MRAMTVAIVFYLASFCCAFSEQGDGNGWLGIIIPEIKVEGNGATLLHGVSEAILKSDGAAKGFKKIKFDHGVGEAEIRESFTQKNIPVEKLLSVIADQLRAEWHHYSGRAVFNQWAPEVGLYISLAEDNMDLFGLEYTDDRSANLESFVRKLEELGSQIGAEQFKKASDMPINKDVSFMEKDLYYITASEREVDYINSLIAVLERGLSIKKVK